ncbi:MULTISPECIES: nuclear transport factor 2 family protein [Streptomyces]|jgi:ketosteroid isomerase-like protein|uniref:Ketosteroid isomerase n=2 Tax=Streptomyces TaxID=1883 RepID=A0A514JM55_9ACTN|nr:MULTISPECIES: nuclear transport factor 2 family protein [Streptomyces]MBA8975487.1 ketosteroid isomerase-like protein [Streptomyces calvus]MYS27964.1 nuclear transport factor 2 family protein [Streptomyces sp. SID7804]QBC75028.1 ketosteroid isomerase [uncultured bacterium]QDI68389.1 ketosteroid isomerase [Streptomyces calvus]
MSEHSNAPETERAPADAVRRYYRLVDDGDVGGLIQLFEPTAEYHRPGYDKLTGHDELERFYREERVIESGRHTIRGLVTADREVAVQGEFRGILRDGRKASVEFADFFTVTPAGRFSRRKTFFYTPLV